MTRTDPNHRSDEDHFAAFQTRGTRESLGILFDRYMHLVYGLCLKYLKDRDDAQDAVMEIFEKIGARKNQTEVSHFKSWLYVVSKNHCLMILRKNSTGLEPYNERFMEISLVAHPNEEPMDLRSESLDECMQKLKVEQETCVRMFYLEGKSYREICADSTHSMKEVKTNIQNGKRNLKNCLDKNDKKG